MVCGVGSNASHNTDEDLKSRLAFRTGEERRTTSLAVSNVDPSKGRPRRLVAWLPGSIRPFRFATSDLTLGK